MTSNQTETASPSRLAQQIVERRGEVPFRERVSVSVADAVRHTGIKKTTIYDLIKSGELASKRVRGRRFVSVASLLKLLGDVAKAA